MHSYFSHPRVTRAARGMTFVDVVVGSALILIIFTSLFAGIRLSLELVGAARAERGALSIASSEIEYIRSLPYADIGTDGGIPSGTIPQTETVSLNGISYTKRVLVQYIDAPDDGTDLNDENGITADYKRARVEVAWESRGREFDVVLLTTIVPNGMESIEGGGTIRISVFDASVLPVVGASVRVVNASTSPDIDVTTQTNDAGVVLFAGAPASGGYSVVVTKDGYSTAQTYAASATNTSPSPAQFAVLESQTSSVSFAIDLLSELSIRSQTPVEHATTTDSFLDATGISESPGATVSGGDVVLVSDGISYQSSGEVYSNAITPSPLDEWDTLVWDDTLPPGTSISYHLYTLDGSTRTLIPDDTLLGNSTGLVSPVDLSNLSVALYDELIIGAELETSNPALTPRIEEWSLSYWEGPVPLPDFSFTLTGTKTIGVDGGGMTVYKYNQTLTTDDEANWSSEDMEWDTYTLTINPALGYDIAELCPYRPLVVNPDTTVNATLTLEDNSAHSLHVAVLDSEGTYLPEATILLYKTGYDEEKESSACGQAFFSGLSADTYTLSIQRDGYEDYQEDVVVGGDMTVGVQLTTSP